ncbi:histone acetyltransferase HAC1 isoform X3 [Prunus yedoensis var. nudiflora]|uniref:Histone acetyltransferase HAC1 isoform X3 n=1 Tax=Prunus yedoensis var. nudiflora TaxID=2094558 RepID=A0A314XSA4_PRUYE|nr:histone acetyltransferase HAC1 isoform X3 [Prunus yedoensis var. nudiflora]
MAFDSAYSISISISKLLLLLCVIVVRVSVVKDKGDECADTHVRTDIWAGAQSGRHSDACAAQHNGNSLPPQMQNLGGPARAMSNMDPEIPSLRSIMQEKM